MGYETAYAHIQANSYFLIRTKTYGTNLKREIRDFAKSTSQSQIFPWYALNAKSTKPPIHVRLVKIRHPKSKQLMIFMTNLSQQEFPNQEIEKLYQKRWEIENSFRDLTSTLKLEQWHSKKLNGILQEIYSLLWLVNTVKFQCHRLQGTSEDILEDTYSKANFKLCVTIVMDHLKLLIRRKLGALMKLIKYWINRTREKRRHLSRHYPRALRKRGRPYWGANAVPRRN